MPRDQADVCVFSPALILTVTVEGSTSGEERDELHFHPGGQGFWIARMLRHLGGRPVVVTSLGGEAGRVLCALAPVWHVRLEPVLVAEESPVYLHDRRSGERREIAQTPAPSRDRHEADDLYGRVLRCATEAGTCVVTGRSAGDALPLDFYRRLGADLASVGTKVLADLHGAELEAFLDGGPLHTLKVSDGDLEEDGTLRCGASVEERVEELARLARLGAERVVLSSAAGRTVARFGERTLVATPPPLEPADHRGSGDAMTAALVAAALRGLDPEHALRLACAAGAANVTRRGLGTADSELVETLAGRTEVKELE